MSLSSHKLGNEGEACFLKQTFSAAAVDRVRLNLIRSIVELEVVISHAKETEVIIPEKNKGENIYQVDPVVLKLKW